MMLQRDEDRYAGVKQALRILALITKRPRTRAELAEALGVHERTVRRLLAAIKDGGVVIRQARRDGSTSELEYSTGEKGGRPKKETQDA